MTKPRFKLTTSLRRDLGAAIVLAWLVSIGALVVRQRAAAVSPDVMQASRALPPATVFYAVRLQGRQLGVLVRAVDTLPEGLRLTERLDLLVPVGDSLARTLLTTEAVVGYDLRLRSLSSTTSGALPASRLSGSADGGGRGAPFTLTLAGGGLAPETHRAGGTDSLTLPLLLPFHIAYGGMLRPGEQVERVLLDPAALTQTRVRAIVAAESTMTVADTAMRGPDGAWRPGAAERLAVWRVDLLGSDAPQHLWIDGAGYVVRGWGGGGWEIERMPYELADPPYRALLRSLPGAQAPAAPAAGAVAELARLAVRLDRTAWDTSDLIGAPALRGRQYLTKAGDTLVVERETLDAAAADSAARRHLDALLRPEPFLPVDDPRVAELARTIQAAGRPAAGAAAGAAADAAADAAALARRLAEWTARSVRAPAPGAARAPSALDALGRREGGPEARALLYVSLARAAGIPARLAGGLARTPAGWRHHTFAEVHVGTWVTVDPSSGALPASAALLRLRSNALGRPVDLAPLAARVHDSVVVAARGRSSLAQAPRP